MKNTYVGEKLDDVIDRLKKDKTLSITQAVKQMCEKFDIKYEEKIRKGINKLLVSRGLSKNSLKTSEAFEKAKKRSHDKRRSTFIITWAQNATPIHDNFFDNIEAYAKELKAGLHVVAGRYKNPTSVFTDKEQDWWANRVKPYLDANRHNIHKYLQAKAEANLHSMLRAFWIYIFKE